MDTGRDEIELNSDSAPEFVPGLRLNELFYDEAVAPILAEEFPGLVYSAALIGYGSDVLGYDSPRSTDHEWGPRMLLFLTEDEVETSADRICSALSRRLPLSFMGHATHFGPPAGDGVRVPVLKATGPIEHKIEVYGARGWLTGWLGIDPLMELTAIDWLVTPQEKLLEVTAGRVYHDGLGTLGEVRAKLAYFPHDVWLYLLAAQWQRLSQQEAFVGRAGEVGDELGSSLVAAALVRDLMQLCFLIERRYAPYSKWFGSAFAKLDSAPRLTPIFRQVGRAETWREREQPLGAAYEIVAGMQNDLGLTSPLDPSVRPYHGRPFQVIHAERFAEAISAAIPDGEVRNILRRVGLVGSIDQISDNVDVKTAPERSSKLRALYAG